MDTKVNYAGIAGRAAAYVVDQAIFMVLSSLIFSYIFFSADFILVEYLLLKGLSYVVLEVLMITKLGWTPGKLLFGIYIKDANTFKNVTLMKIVTRSTFKALLLLPSYIFDWFLILPVLILIPTIFDQHKQTFYDKFVKTVVIDYKPEECHLNLNYVGITRRVVAYIIDGFIVVVGSLICLILVGIIFHIAGYKSPITRTCLSFLLSIVFGIFMIRRFGGTPGQLSCGINIKDANTLENITLVQAIIRHVSFEVIHFPILIMGREIFSRHISEWWFDPLINLTLTATIPIFISAIFDRRKQFLHDKIANTVAIDYKPSS